MRFLLNLGSPESREIVSYFVVKECSLNDSKIFTIELQEKGRKFQWTYLKVNAHFCSFSRFWNFWVTYFFTISSFYILVFRYRCSLVTEFRQTTQFSKSQFLFSSVLTLPIKEKPQTFSLKFSSFPKKHFKTIMPLWHLRRKSPEEVSRW